MARAERINWGMRGLNNRIWLHPYGATKRALRNLGRIHRTRKLLVLCAIANVSPKAHVSVWLTTESVRLPASEREGLCYGGVARVALRNATVADSIWATCLTLAHEVCDERQTLCSISSNWWGVSRRDTAYSGSATFGLMRRPLFD